VVDGVVGVCFAAEVLMLQGTRGHAQLQAHDLSKLGGQCLSPPRRVLYHLVCLLFAGGCG